MKYINRQLEYIVKRAAKTFPAILVTGPRQSGKTTFLLNLLKGKARFVSLDEADVRVWANEDPRGFLEVHTPPVIIDEIQYAPGLLTYIKRKIDEKRQPGQWYLSGSQQFALMKNVSESLAGRVAVLTLLPFSRAEIKGELKKSWLEWFTGLTAVTTSRTSLQNVLMRGSYPEVIVKKKIDPRLWYDSYITTCLERDVSSVYDIGQLNTFYKMLVALASRCGQILNYSSISNELGISMAMVKKWISVLEAGHIIYLLPPYYPNIGKRLIKSPKIYFLDTGLATYLCGIRDANILLRSHVAGQLFENFVVSEFIKNFHAHGERPSLFFINNKNIWEVDLLLEYGMNQYPIEIKLTSTITEHHLKNFKLLRNALNTLQEDNYLITNLPEYRKINDTHLCHWSAL